MFCFGGADIKKGKNRSKNFFLIAMFQRNKENLFSDIITELFLYGETAECFQRRNQLFVGVYIDRFCEGTGFHVGCQKPKEPDKSKGVIAVLVAYKDMMNMLNGNLHVVKFLHNGVSAAAVYQEKFFLLT